MYSAKRIEKVSSDNIVIAFDLLSTLTYMASLSAARVPREVVLRRAGEQLRIDTAVFFRAVHLLAQRLRLEYSRALQLVAQKARAQNVKSFMLRFASTIDSGESEHEFIREELRIEGVRYANHYERAIENLKKWTEAYAALLVSVSLIMVVALTSTLMGAIDQQFVLLLGAVMFCITEGGVYIILRSSPYEQVTYDGATEGTRDRRKARLFARTLGPVGVVTALAAGYIGGPGPALLLMGIFLLPTGYYATKDDRKVRGLDREVTTLIRGLGNVAGATGSTRTSALNKLDLKAMGSLEPHIVRLKIRLAAQLPRELCWEYFKSEAGSELLRRSLDTLADGVELGGEGEEIGEIAGAYASSVSELRETRSMTSSSFSFLLIPMHAAMTGLLLFILEIISTFNGRLGDAAIELSETASAAASTHQAALQMFQPQDLTIVSGMVTTVVVTLTVANALASKIAAGGHNLKLAFSLGVLCIISGVNMLLVPRFASLIFG